MNNSKGKDTQAARPAEQQLQAYLEEAVEAGANAIVLKYDSFGECAFRLKLKKTSPLH